MTINKNRLRSIEPSTNTARRQMTGAGLSGYGQGRGQNLTLAEVSEDGPPQRLYSGGSDTLSLQQPGPMTSRLNSQASRSKQKHSVESTEEKSKWFCNRRRQVSVSISDAMNPERQAGNPC